MLTIDIKKNDSIKSLLRFATAGSVDDGKSTLIGRLLYDTGNIPSDQIQHLVDRQGIGKEEISPEKLALVTDGLKAEREQNITIDVAYRYFSTEKRKFILADTPGHEQYTRNMVTGCSTANVVLLLIDATKGLLPQTKRHALLADLLKVPRLVVVVNKMDLVDYREEIYQQIQSDFLSFSGRLSVRQVDFIPVSALNGDNVVTTSTQMSWYQGMPLLHYLDNVYIGSDINLRDLRFPVQHVLLSEKNKRRYAGTLLSGKIRVGDEVLLLPSGMKTEIETIEIPARSPGVLVERVDTASAPLAVTISTKDERDISRGDVIVRPKNTPRKSDEIDAYLVWFDTKPLEIKKNYVLLHTSTEVVGSVSEIDYQIDIESLSRKSANSLELNGIARVQLSLSRPLFYDAYQKNSKTGSFVLVDNESYQTVAAGMIIERGGHDDILFDSIASTYQHYFKSKNLHREEGMIESVDREHFFDQRPTTLWFTGLSGSGKSTVAKHLEKHLFDQGKAVYRLDGDNVRMGLNRDLGFSARDRTENIRRIAEVAKLFNHAGLIVICSFISPRESQRELAREIIGEEFFKEIYFSTPLEICEGRDPHGLYQKARAGEIKNFTGISAPFEAPQSADCTIDTGTLDIQQSVEQLIKAFDL